MFGNLRNKALTLGIRDLSFQVFLFQTNPISRFLLSNAWNCKKITEVSYLAFCIISCRLRSISSSLLSSLLELQKWTKRNETYKSSASNSTPYSFFQFFNLTRRIFLFDNFFEFFSALKCPVLVSFYLTKNELPSFPTPHYQVLVYYEVAERIERKFAMQITDQAH